MRKKCSCDAQQHSDQMICAPCGLVWDINDPEPPECGCRGQRGINEAYEKHKAFLEKIGLVKGKS